MNPRGSQFESFGSRSQRAVFARSEFSTSSGVSLDTYSYAHQTPRGFQAHQTMNVLHQPDEYAHAYSGSTKGGWHISDLPDSYTESRYEDTKSSPGLPDQAEADLLGPAVARGPQQQKLFGTAFKPGSSTVHTMIGTKEARPMTLTMLGIAQNRTLQEHGRSLTPSTDLSQHSAALVGNLQSRGVLGGETPSITNQTQFRTDPVGFDPTGAERLSHQEVMQGRSTARNMIRGSRPAQEQAQPEQGTLF